MYKYKRVRIDSAEALLLHAQGWTIINVDSASGYALFERLDDHKRGQRVRVRAIRKAGII